MEIWKDVVGYEGYYQISNLGNVRSFDRIHSSGLGRSYFKPGRILKTCVASHGYLSVALCFRKQTSAQIHKLIAKAFIPNPNNYKCVNHKDGNKLNNNIDNLEWVSHAQNNKHAYDTGLKKPFRKVTTEEVIQIRALSKCFNMSNTLLANMYGLVQPTVCCIVNYKSRNNG